MYQQENITDRLMYDYKVLKIERLAQRKILKGVDIATR